MYKRKQAIIFEGPDGAGKTYLLDQIIERLGLKVLHSSGPATQRGLISRAAHMYESLRKGDFLMDRHPAISEQVYGSVLRDYPLLHPTECNMLLGAIDPIVFYLRPSKQLLLERKAELLTKSHKSAKHVKEVQDSYMEILETYDRVMNRLAEHFMVLQMDPMNVSHVNMIDQIVRNVEGC